MNTKSIAVFFPGIGYHNDKPLLYYSRRILSGLGYETYCVGYENLPQKIRGDKAGMDEAAKIAYGQAKEALDALDLKDYQNVVFVGKSIGTGVAAKYAMDRNIHAKLVLYTPVEKTFSFSVKNAIAFIGTNDPWSELKEVERLAKEQDVPLYEYEKCNHSLECENWLENIEILHDVMEKTLSFVNA
ncbi:MAG: alpha/beta hydrolase [Lachnospiraceae bacterium]|nr:alpha/beta hydrolase [Lachnospiraceae bacterium]